LKIENFLILSCPLSKKRGREGFNFINEISLTMTVILFLPGAQGTYPERESEQQEMHPH
jgi:hypothetical protein